MSDDVTVKKLADVVGTPVDRLLTQLAEAGVDKNSADDAISEDEKMLLLGFLRESHGKEGSVEEASEPKRVTLRRRSVSELKRTGAQGRVKTVNIEVRKKRTYAKRSVVIDEEKKRIEGSDAAVKAAELEAQRHEESRAKAEETALVKAEEEARLQAEEEARTKVEEAERVREEQERKAEEVALKQAAEEETRLKVMEDDSKRKKDSEKPRKAPEPAKTDNASTDRNARGKGRKSDQKSSKYGRSELHVAAAKSGRRKKKGRRSTSSASAGGGQHAFEMPTAPIVHEVSIPESISVNELAQKMTIKATDVIKAMMGMGSMVTINQVLDQDTAVLVVEEMGHTPIPVQDNSLEDTLVEDEQDDSEQMVRAPVVTIMGHVDHGKTSLLDHIRSTRVASGEAGGITQHIGAYHVETDKGMVSFLDTPGHAAFTAMRARGAKATDIVILVVAADDGVMPQTVEAIQHSRAAEVPLIVAINKIDKEDSDPERVKQELTAHEVIPEDWGGENMFVNVSAKTGEGIDDLLDSILLQAEVLELRARVTGRATGVVVESSLDKGRGPVATVLVQNGTLRKGDVLLTGHEYGRVRAMFDESGSPIDEAGPSMPVVVLGLSGTANSGDDVAVVQDERKAREIALFRQGKFREVKLAKQQASKLEDMFTHMEEGQVSTLNVVLKADVQGSVEALCDSLEKLSTDEVKVKIVGQGVGGINESDVHLAVASNAIVIGFNVRADGTARKLIAEETVDLHYYGVIYDAIDEIKRAMSGMLAPEFKEEIVGLAEVRDVFRSPKIGAIAGCMVIEGIVKRNNPIRVLRENVVIYEGSLESLRRFKDDVLEVKLGTECGIGVKNYNDIKPGDQVEVFETIEVKRTL